MKNRTTRAFWRHLEKLPKRARTQAQKSFQKFSIDPFDESLHFKRVRGMKHLWSARVGDDYRALGVRQGDEVTWDWIGTHAEYDKLI